MKQSKAQEQLLSGPCGDIDFGLTDRAGKLESIERRTSTLQDFMRFVASLLLQHTRWFVL